jgi:hypothetical protein
MRGRPLSYGASDVWQATGFCVERLLAHVGAVADAAR